MEKKIIFLCFLVALLTFPEFISSEVIRDSVIHDEEKFANRSYCIKTCATEFTGGDESRIKDVRPRHYKCVCWYYSD
uniref:U-scoloptoxin(15)-Ssd3b n=1 Tax=Scolopendra dehaani TaxID=2609776 RepID=TXF3B_SCODE|nr:RecName: Full=U-scoloptoxin(15)-Ssd3b; Short=U-SLPTX(15)-Ssd3a; AltName: Full=Toxin SSD1014; Flags: Precursor [Scolopendra dehaani]